MVKVLYVISSWGHGRGGHFYSLKTIRDSMPFESAIVNIGALPSPVLEGDAGVHFFDVTSGIVAALRQVFAFARSRNYTHLHSFDYSSFLFASLVSVVCRIPHVHTKPGGPSPLRYHPFVKYFTLFTQEDYDYFSERSYLGHDVLVVISNRVNTFDFDDVLVRDIKQKSNGALVLLRIARISKEYEGSIRQTLTLSKALNASGVRVVPVIVGALQDQDAYVSLELEMQEAGAIVLVDDKHTLNAKKLLSCADLVVGTGRSFMEAALVGPILLAPSKSGEFPVLIREDNYEGFKHSNFTGRGQVDSTGDVVSAIIEIVNTPAVREDYNAFVSKVWSDDFYVGGAIEKYKEVYRSAKTSNNQIHVLLNLVFWGIRKVIGLIRGR